MNLQSVSQRQRPATLEVPIVIKRSPLYGGVALFVAMLLVACHAAGTNFTPGVSPDEASTDVAPAAGTPTCTAPKRKIPGKYLSYFAFGNVKGTTFTASKTKGDAIWLLES